MVSSSNYPFSLTKKSLLYFSYFSLYFLTFFLFTESSVGVVRSKATELIGRAPIFFLDEKSDKEKIATVGFFEIRNKEKRQTNSTKEHISMTLFVTQKLC